MATYYFDIQDEDGAEPDRIGTELRDLTMAEREAVRTIASLGSEALCKERKKTLTVIVRDAEGPVLEVAAAFRLRPLRV